MRKLSLYKLKGKEGVSIIEAIGLRQFKIFSGGVHIYKPGEISHPNEHHVHSHPELFIGLEGEGEFLINGKRYPFRGGDLFLIEPGEEHHVIAKSEDPIKLVWLHLKKESSHEHK